MPSPSLSYVPWFYKNGRDTVLRDINGNELSGYFYIYNDTSYVLGVLKSGTSSSTMLWKNGVATTIPNITPQMAVTNFVISGNDRYFLCREESGTGANTVRTFKLWKNGLLTTISSDVLTYVSRVIVSGTDVYILAQYGNMFTPNPKIRVCKNGVWESWFGMSNGWVEAFGFAVNNGDVYVAGKDQTPSGTYATIWKNGTPTHLNTGNFYSWANDVAVSGSDVYVVGTEGISANIQKATIWKNGVPTRLTNGQFGATAAKIVLAGSDIYVGGTEQSRLPLTTVNEFTPSFLRVWKNGVPTTYTDGSTQATLIYMSFF